MIPVRLRVEAGAVTKQAVLDLLYLQAGQFFGEEEFRLDGEVEVQVESYFDTTTAGRQQQRWAGTASFVNYREERP